MKMSEQERLLDRRQRVLILARHMLDWIHETQRVGARSSAEAGIGVTRRRRHARCRGTGRVLGEGAGAKPCHLCRREQEKAEEQGRQWKRPGHRGCRPCLGCDQGWVQLRSDEGSEDAYVKAGQTATLEASHRRDHDRRRVDALLFQLEVDEEIRRGKVAAETPLLRAVRLKEAQWRHGDFAALHVALLRLAMANPARYLVFVRWEVEQDADGIPPRDLLDDIADWIALRMPERIRVPVEFEPAVENEARKENFWRGRHPATARQRAERDAEIRRRRYEEGWTLRRLGDFYSLSHVQVSRIAPNGDSEAA